MTDQQSTTAATIEQSSGRRPDRLATRAEVAEYLGVPEATLTRWAHVRTRPDGSAAGPAYKVVGRHARYRWSDVEQWLDDQSPDGGPSRAARPTRRTPA